MADVSLDDLPPPPQAMSVDDLPPPPTDPKILAQLNAATPTYPIEAPPFMARIGRGMLDISQGIEQRALQAADALTGGNRAEQFRNRVNDDLALYDRGRQAAGGGFDWARTFGGVAATAPLAVVAPAGATALARLGSGALTGGLTGLAQYAPSGTAGETARNTALGAGIGALAAPVLGWTADKGVAIARRLIGYAKGLQAGVATPDQLAARIPEFAQLSPDAQQSLIADAQAQLRSTGSLDAEQLARKANLLAQGVTPTKSMVTRDAADFTIERNLQKLSQSPDTDLSNVGRQLTDVYNANDAALRNRLDSFSQGLPQGTQEAHGQAVMEALDQLSNSTQDEVSKVYDAVRQAHGDQLASDARNLAATLDDLRDNTYAEKLVGSVTNKLRRLGMMDADGNLTPNSLTVSQAEELRKFVNRLPNDYGKRDIISSIDADVLSGAGGDAFAAARGAAAGRFAILNNPATQRALNSLGTFSQGRTAQNFIESNVIRGADQDVAGLMSALEKLPADQATNAVNEVRAGVLQYLRDQAVNPNSGQFSGAALNKAMTDIGPGKLLRVLGVAQYQQLRNLSRAAVDATYAPPYSAINSSNTAPMLLSLMRRTRGAIGIPLPFVNDVAERALERMGARSQLAGILAARPAGTLPPAPGAIAALPRILPRYAPALFPALYPVLNPTGEPANAAR